jgi:hypothetical protein
MATAFDPQLTADGLALAGYHIEAGNRDFPSFARAMLADAG